VAAARTSPKVRASFYAARERYPAKKGTTPGGYPFFVRRFAASVLLVLEARGAEWAPLQCLEFLGRSATAAGEALPLVTICADPSLRCAPKEHVSCNVRF
jgi:hypothetical protein